MIGEAVPFMCKVSDNVHCEFGAMALQVFAKEEELAEFQAKLGEREAALKAYKTENGRFADMKDKFKADIASLQQQVCIQCDCSD